MAARRAASTVRRTPVLTVEADGLVGHIVDLKLEGQQRTGSFKFRNAAAALTARPLTTAGVVAASGGNFGAAVAVAARAHATPATIFVPEAAEPTKVQAIERSGATVHVVSGPIRGLFDAAQQHAADAGATLLHPFDDRAGAAGAGGCALELHEQLPDIDTVLVAVGGGGLLAGTRAALPAEVAVVAVETSGTATFHRSVAAGRRLALEPEGVATAALGAPRIGELGWAARDGVHRSVVVDDAAVLQAQRRLWERTRLASEAGGAVALAALTSGAYRPADGERVAVILCGANTTPP